MAGPSLFIRQQVPIATVNNDGLMSANQAAQLANGLDDVAIYVDSTNGNDANPGTQASPLATFDAAWAALPSTWTGACEIILAAASASVAGDYEMNQTIYFAGRPAGNHASPLLIVGPEIDQLGTVTSIGGSTASSYVATVATTTGTLRGASLRNLTTGQQARITNNVFGGGNTTFSLLTQLAVTVGDQFVVTKPGANLLSPQYGLPFIVDSTIGYQNIRFAAADEAGFEFPLVVFNVNAVIEMYNCEMDGGTSNRDFFVGPGSFLGGSAQGDLWDNDATATVAATASGFWYYNAGATPGGACGGFYGARLVNNFLLDNCYLYAQASALELANINAVNSSINAYEMSELELDSGLLTGSHPFQNDTVLVQENSFATVANPSDIGGATTVTINGSAGNALSFNNARGHVFDVEGTGNAGVGILALISQVVIDTATPPTVTGTGNTIVGTTTKTYGALPYTEAATLSTIQEG
jgi:hypothetical protein